MLWRTANPVRPARGRTGQDAAAAAWTANANPLPTDCFRNAGRVPNRTASGASGQWRPKKREKYPPHASQRVAGLNDFETSAAECHQTGCGQSLQGGGVIRTSSVVPVERFASPGPERTLPFPPSSVQGASASSGRRTRGASRGASAAGQRPGQAGYPTATLTTIFTTGSGSAQAQHGAWASSGKRIMNWPATTGTGTTSTSAAKSPASCFSS